MSEEIDFSERSCISLHELHSKLNLSQSSLPSCLQKLPSRLNIYGIIISYEEIQMVQWKKEVIITINDGGIETLKFSMWLSHENPVGIRYETSAEILGRVIFVKNVHILSFDFTQANELQFYGEMNPTTPSMHVILFPIVSGGSYFKFKSKKTRLAVNDLMSVIPKKLQKKRAFQHVPNFNDEYLCLEHTLDNLFTYHHCLAHGVEFGHAKNPFQTFINSRHASLSNYYAEKQSSNYRPGLLTYQFISRP